MTDLAPATATDRRPTPAEQVHQDIVRQAERALEEIRRRTVTGRAPELRTVDNRLDAHLALVALVREQLHEVHALANDRPHAAERLNVLGGSRDYALDSHGDPKARELYRHVALELVNLIELMSASAHTMHRWLRHGELDSTSRRGTQVVTSDEFIEALAAQQRRAERGEGDRPLIDQPTHKRATDTAALQRTVRDLEGVLGKVLPRLTNEQKGRLTTTEQLAHRAAVNAHRTRRETRGKPTP